MKNIKYIIKYIFIYQNQKPKLKTQKKLLVSYF